MPQFLALTARGLLGVVESELIKMGITRTQRKPGAVYFESNWEKCYEAHLRLRAASRVGLTVLDFPAYQPDDLYHNTFKHDFTKYITCDQTLAVDASTRESKLTDQRLAAMKIKDAIVDQFRKKFDRRPNVNVKDPDLRVLCRIVKNQVSLSIDLTGTPLFKRGYRKKTVTAPLKENLAAGLLQLAGWDGKTPIIDPLCGSGTILIEAALMATKSAPGLLRKGFMFQRQSAFDKEVWEGVVDRVSSEEVEDLGDLKFYGFDISGRALDAFRANAQAAGVEDYMVMKKQRVDALEPPCEKGIIIVNPPYGERLQADEFTKDVYKDLSYSLKRHFKGWTCWLLSGDPELLKSFNLKSSEKHLVYNGPIECRFLKYEIR